MKSKYECQVCNKIMSYSTYKYNWGYINRCLDCALIYATVNDLHGYIREIRGAIKKFNVEIKINE